MKKSWILVISICGMACVLCPLEGRAQEAVLNEAHQAFISRNYSLALSRYQKAFDLPLKPDLEAQALFQLAECHRMLEDWELASRAYVKLVTTFPESDLTDNAYLAMANRLMMQSREQYPDAVSYYETIVMRYPDSDSEPAAWLGLSRAKEFLNLYDSAEDALTKVIRKHPGIPLLGDAYYQLGQLLANPSNPRRDVSLAIQNLRMVVEKYPYSNQFIYACFSLGNLTWELKQYENAIGYYRLVVNRFPDSFLAPLSLTNIGLCFSDLKVNSKAIQAYEELLEKYSQPPAVRENILKLIERLQSQEKAHLQVSAWQADVQPGTKKTIYRGDVRLSMGRTTIVCDRASVDPSVNELTAEGRIRITYDINISITADRLRGDLAGKSLILEGNVGLNRSIGNQIHTESWSALEFSLVDGSSRGYSTPAVFR